MKEINGTMVTVNGGTMSDKEILAYISMIRDEHPNNSVTELEIVINADDTVALDYNLRPVPFQRIRRITGYLVGTLDRFGNAKRAEEHDRVKHTGGGAAPARLSLEHCSCTAA